MFSFGQLNIEGFRSVAYNFQIDALHDLVPFVLFNKCEWRSIDKSATLLLVTLPHGCFSHFLKLHKWYQITQII